MGENGFAAATRAFTKGFYGLVFDIDGVMFDSQASNMVYYNSIRRAVRLPDLSPEEEAFCHMASVQEAINAIIPEHLRKAAFDAGCSINYREHIMPMLSPEPGLKEALSQLREWGVRCAIFTNRSSSVDDLLKYFDLEPFFTPVRTAANSEPKPDPAGLFHILDDWRLAPEQIAFLGDSAVDEKAAAGAGVPFWAYRNQKLAAALHVTDFFMLMRNIKPLVEGR